MKKFLLLMMCACFCLSVVACGTPKESTNSTERKKEMDIVRLGEVTHSVFYAPQYAAINLGFF